MKTRQLDEIVYFTDKASAFLRNARVLVGTPNDSIDHEVLNYIDTTVNLLQEFGETFGGMEIVQ